MCLFTKAVVQCDLSSEPLSAKTRYGPSYYEVVAEVSMEFRLGTVEQNIVELYQMKTAPSATTYSAVACSSKIPASRIECASLIRTANRKYRNSKVSGQKHTQHN